MAYQAPRKKKEWWETALDWVGQSADKIIPGDQSSWHSGGSKKSTPQVQPVNRPQIRVAEPQVQPILKVGNSPIGFDNDDPLEMAKPITQKIELAQPQFDEKAVDERLDKGYSWERIAKETNTDLDKVKQYSKKTRPNYGIAPKKVQPKHEFYDYRMENVGNKKILGMDVGQFMGDYGDVNKMHVDQTVKMSKDDLLKGFDSISKENAKLNTGKQTRDLYVNKLRDMAEKGDERAKFTLKTLNDAGKLEGDWTDFFDSANKKFYGGLQQSGARAIEYLPGDQGTGKWADEQEKLNRAAVERGKQGEIAGQVMRYGLDTGATLIPAAKVSQAIGKIPAIANAGTKTRFLARELPASQVFTGAFAGSQTLQGEDVNLAKEAALGTAIDLGLPVAGKVVSKIPGVDQAGKFVVDQAGNFVRQTGNVVEAGKNNVREIRNSVDDLLDDTVRKFTPPKPATIKINNPDGAIMNGGVRTTDLTPQELPVVSVKRADGRLEQYRPKSAEELAMYQRQIDDARIANGDAAEGVAGKADANGDVWHISSGTQVKKNYTPIEEAPVPAFNQPDKRAIDANATMQRLRQRAANPVQQPNIAQQYGLKEDTVERLVRDYGQDRARSIIQRSSDATNIRNMDAFVVSEAQKKYGKVAPTGRVKVNNNAPEAPRISDEELAAMEAAEFGTPPVRNEGVNLTADDIEMYKADIQNALDEAGFDDVSLADVIHIGSTKKGTAHAGSDVDMLVTYNGTAREDDVFNALADYAEQNGLEFNGRKIDFNPVRADDVDQIAALTGTTKPVNDIPTTPEQLDAMPTQTSDRAPLEYPDTPRPIREPIQTDAPLGKVMKTFYDSKKGNNKISYRELEAMADTTAARAYNDFLSIGSDLRKVAQITQEQVDAGVKSVDNMPLTPQEKQLWKAVQAEQDYMRRRSSLGNKEIGGDQGDSYWNRVSPENRPTRETLLEGYLDKKPGSEMKRRSDEFALKADKISYSPKVISKYIVEHGDTKLLQEERIYRALQRDYPDLPEEQIRKAAQQEIKIQNAVNKQKVKIGAAGLGKKVTVTDGKVIDLVDEFNKVGDTLAVPKTEVVGTPKGLTNGARINSVSVDVGGKLEPVADLLGMNQLRDSTAYAYTHTTKAGGDRELLATTVENRLRTAYNGLTDDEIDYAVESILRIKPGLDDKIVAGRVEGIYRNAAKNQMVKSLHSLRIQDKTLKKDVSDLAKQILREGTTERELSAAIAQKTLRAQNALFRKLNVSSALNELSDLSAFYNIYGKNTKIFTPDFKLVKQLGLGEIDPALEPYLKQIDEGVPLNKVLTSLKKLNEGTRLYKFVETYKAGVLAKTAKEFYSNPKNGGLVGDELTARILQDYRDFALPVDMFTKTFLDDYPLYTQYMTWGARNLEKEGKMLTGQFDAGLLKNMSKKERFARDLYANIPAKTAFWLASNGLKGTAIMTAFGLTDFTGLTNQDYSGIAEEDKSWFDRTTQWTNMSTTLSLFNTSIQALEKERLKQEYADADYNPYENANFGESFVNTYTPQFLKNALGANDLQQRGYSDTNNSVVDQASRLFGGTPEEGRIQYEAPEDAWNKFKSFVFGKNQTENAREYSGRENIVDRIQEGQNPFTAMGDMAAEQIGVKDTDYNRPLTDDYSEAYRAAEEGAQTALLQGGRQYNDYLDNFEKEQPELYKSYIEMLDSKNAVNPEYWRNVSGGNNLETFKMIRNRKQQLQKDLGTAYDPLYGDDLSDEQVAAVLRYKSAPTGDDLAVRNTLNKEQWYKDLKARQKAFYDANPKEEGEAGFKQTQRVKEWNTLDDQLSSFYYDAEEVKKNGAPAWAEKFPTVFQQKAINDQYGFESEESKNFFRANGDQYRAEKEAFDKTQLDIINQMRKIEGYPEMSWEAYQQATEIANTDGDSSSKSGWKNYSKGGGKRGGGSSISPNADVTYNSAGTLKINKPTVKVPKVKIKRKGDVKKITFKRSKRG